MKFAILFTLFKEELTTIINLSVKFLHRSFAVHSYSPCVRVYGHIYHSHPIVFLFITVSF